MGLRLGGFACVAFAVWGIAWAQTPESPPPAERGDLKWRPSGSSPAPRDTGSASPSGTTPLAPTSSAPRRPVTQVTRGTGTLPSDSGQVWREYDISPYTSRAANSNKPEQTIVEWVLRETGYEAWHGEPVALLSASPKALRVYHTPEMQAVVADMVDRFVATAGETHQFGVRVISVGSPNWRLKAQGILRPIAAQSPGTQAWLMEKEDAALLLAELSKRTDFREHTPPQTLAANAQVKSVSLIRGRSYVRGIGQRAGTIPGFEAQSGQFDEGFALEVSPLLSLDGRAVDAVVKCQIDQCEKLHALAIDLPAGAGGARQRGQLEVPQTSQARLHERFRWPTEKVLLVSLGVVPTPSPNDPNALKLPLPLAGGPPRADVLIAIDSKGKINLPPAAAPAAGLPAAPPATAVRPAPFGPRQPR